MSIQYESTWRKFTPKCIHIKNLWIGKIQIKNERTWKKFTPKCIHINNLFIYPLHIHDNYIIFETKSHLWVL